MGKNRKRKDKSDGDMNNNDDDDHEDLFVTYRKLLVNCLELLHSIA